MDICRENRTSKGETTPIDQSTQLVPFYFLIAPQPADPLFGQNVLGIGGTMGEIDFPDLIPDWRRSRKMS